MKKLGIVAALVAVLAVSSVASAYFYPATGDLWYNGYSYSDSYINWGSSPGPWVTSEGGYEHDFQAEKTYFSACTSTTNLPNGYDDCPTAGVLEDDPNNPVFTFGSFQLKNYVQPNTTYFGSWSFTAASDVISNMNLYGQEVAPKFCPGWSIWCYGAFQTTTLLSGQTLIRGTTRYYSWSR